MRARNIKPGFFSNEYLAELDPIIRLLFIGIWCNADRDGRLEFRPKRLRANILPYDEIPLDTFLCMCRKLHDSEFITIYKHANTEYIEIPRFSKHQNPHKGEKSLNLPIAPKRAPYNNSVDTVPEQFEHSTKRDESGLMIDESGKRKEERGLPKNATRADSSLSDFSSESFPNEQENLAFIKFTQGNPTLLDFHEPYPHTVKMYAVWRKVMSTKHHLKGSILENALKQICLEQFYDLETWTACCHAWSNCSYYNGNSETKNYIKFGRAILPEQFKKAASGQITENDKKPAARSPAVFSHQHLPITSPEDSAEIARILAEGRAELKANTRSRKHQGGA